MPSNPKRTGRGVRLSDLDRDQFHLIGYVKERRRWEVLGTLDGVHSVEASGSRVAGWIRPAGPVGGTGGDREGRSPDPAHRAPGRHAGPQAGQ